MLRTVLITFDGSVAIARRMECNAASSQSIAYFNKIIDMTSSMDAFQGRVFSTSSVIPEEILSDVERIQ